MCLLKDPQFTNRMDIPSPVCSILEAAKSSLDTISKQKLKHATKQLLRKSHTDYWDSTLSTLQVQSKFKDIVSLEPESQTWNRILLGLPANQLSFLIRAGSDTLPTPLNLKRWHYRVANTCPLCDSPNPTTAHILNSCSEALNQGRFTWRHDSVLSCLTSYVKNEITPFSDLYADIPSFRASDFPPSTLSRDVITSSGKPDLVLIEGSVFTIIELTIPFNTKEALQAARLRKSNKQSYHHLISDLEDKGYTVHYHTLEIGSLGHYEQCSLNCIRKEFSLPKHCCKKLFLKLSKAAISCSYHIFNSRNSRSWDTNLPFYCP